MLWLIIGSFVLGAACGAIMRLVLFIIFILGAAVIIFVGTLAQGGGWALLHAVIGVVMLQVGYEAEIALGTAVRSWGRQRRENVHKTIHEDR